MKRRSFAGSAFLVLAVVGLILSLACASFAAGKKIECRAVAGKVMAADAGAEWAERNGTFEVRTGSRIKLDASGEAVVSYSDGTLVTLRPGTELEIKADGLRLNEGGVWIKLVKTKSGFKVDTPSVTIGARGTIFSVLKKQEKTLVKLVEGLIDVVNRESGRTVAMKAGDTVIVKAKEIIELNKLDQSKINAVLKENSFDPVEIDLKKVPDIFKFGISSSSTPPGGKNPLNERPAASKEIELKKKINENKDTPGAETLKPEGAPAGDTSETETGSEEPKADASETGSAGTGNERTLNDLIGR